MYKNTIYFLAVFLISAVINAQDLAVGVSHKSITPELPVFVSGGTGDPSPANALNGDLTARALVITKGDTRIVIVSIDNLGVPKLVGDRIRVLVPDIDPENILIGATHTHSAPDVYGFADENGNSGTDINYVDWLVNQTADAINEAYKNIKPAYQKVAVGEAKGKIAYNYYAPQLYDPQCGVLQFIAAHDHKPIATLINYAIHPEIIGSDRGICSPDLIGPLYRKIESEVGGMAIFMNSAQGGMVTADNRLDNGKEANDWNECIRIGELLAMESLRIISGAEIQKDPEIQILSNNIKLPVDTDLMKFIIQHSIFDYQVAADGGVTTRMNLLKMGDAQIVTIPGEALPNIGYYLKRKMKTDKPFLFGLTNDAFGYIMTKEDFNSFKRYEYISRTSLGEKTADIIINGALDLINKD